MMDILVIFIFLIIISNTARNILVYAFWSMSVSAALGVEKMGHRVCSCSTLLGNTKHFPNWSNKFTILPIVMRVSTDSHSLQYLVWAGFIFWPIW